MRPQDARRRRRLRGALPQLVDAAASASSRVTAETDARAAARPASSSSTIASRRRSQRTSAVDRLRHEPPVARCQLTVRAKGAARDRSCRPIPHGPPPRARGPASARARAPAKRRLGSWSTSCNGIFAERRVDSCHGTLSRSPTARMPAHEQILATTPPASHRSRNLYQVAQQQFEKAADFMNLTPRRSRQILSQPKNELIVNFPVRSWTTASTSCSRATASSTTTCSGPYKGGMRYHHEVTLDEIKALGVVDDVQVRAARHPVRRRQGRHQVRPAPATRKAELERITRRFTPRSAPTSAPSSTSPRPTSAPTARRWSG